MIGVIGLGKLGLPTALVLAKSHRVWGYDVDRDLVRRLKNRKFDTPEPGVKELLSRRDVAFIDDRCDLDYFVSSTGTDVVFIVVPTPSDERHHGAFSTRCVRDVLKTIGTCLRPGQIINVVSTVMPGACERELIPFVEREYGLTHGEDFHLTYNPEFVAVGSVIDNFANPDKILIGSGSSYPVRVLRTIYEKTVDNEPVFSCMSLEEAETTKLLNNVYCTLKISFANFVAMTCPIGVDPLVVLESIGTDARIGGKLLRPGLGFGGPCFPRDVRAYGRNRLTDFITFTNARTLCHGLEFLQKIKGDVLTFGIAYKRDSYLIDESQAYSLTTSLVGARRVYVFDDNIEDVPPGCVKVDDTDDLTIDACVLMHDYSEHAQFKAFMRRNPKCEVYDMVHCLKKGAYENLHRHYDHQPAD